MYRQRNSDVEVLLLHPGGPFWARKDEGAWTIPKGEIEEGEETQKAAKREFEEETGLLPRGDFYPLRPVKLKSGKTIYAWAFKGDWDPTTIKSTTFTMEWPPHSGRLLEYPEADRAAWFTLEQAKAKIQKGQIGFVEELSVLLAQGLSSGA
jgi:predicted NUDIX family NTP pyrophosphohydrolase